MIDEIKDKIARSEYFVGAVKNLQANATLEQKFSSVLSCRFKDKSKVHNWEKYVDEFYKENWKKLSQEARLLIFEGAAKLAHWEEWS
jgi:hypothetical protein